MKKHSSSRHSLVLVAVLGVVALGSLIVAATLSIEDVATPAPSTVGPPPPLPAAPLPPPSQPPSQQPSVNRYNYENALFEITCARAKIGDTRLQRQIVDEVYRRYDWDEESFNHAFETQMGNPETLRVLTARMYECTPELAESFGREQVVPSAPDRQWRAGKYVDDELHGGDLVGAKLRITLDDQGQVKVAFQGKRDDKGFMIPLLGEMDDRGKFIATGTRGPHNARATGRYEDGQLVGVIQGSIHKRGLRVKFTASDAMQPTPTSISAPAVNIRDDNVRGAGLEAAQLRLRVSGTTVSGSLQGKRDGKGFSIPMRGAIDEDGAVHASGSRGPNNVRLSGRYVSDRIHGELQGSVLRSDYRVNFRAE